jgi:CHAD domain-containing protein
VVDPHHLKITGKRNRNGFEAVSRPLLEDLIGASMNNDTFATAARLDALREQMGKIRCRRIIWPMRIHPC